MELEPQCAQPCISSALKAFGCNSGDLSCACAPAAQEAVGISAALCISKNCPATQLGRIESAGYAACNAYSLTKPYSQPASSAGAGSFLTLSTNRSSTTILTPTTLFTSASSTSMRITRPPKTSTSTTSTNPTCYTSSSSIATAVAATPTSLPMNIEISISVGIVVVVCIVAILFYICVRRTRREMEAKFRSSTSSSTTMIPLKALDAHPPSSTPRIGSLAVPDAKHSSSAAALVPSVATEGNSSSPTATITLLPTQYRRERAMIDPVAEMESPSDLRPRGCTGQRDSHSGRSDWGRVCREPERRAAEVTHPTIGGRTYVEKTQRPMQLRAAGVPYSISGRGTDAEGTESSVRLWADEDTNTKFGGANPGAPEIQIEASSYAARVRAARHERLGFI